MKKNKKEVNDPITIYNFDAMEHERLAEQDISLVRKKKVSSNIIYLILAIIFKVFQYLSIPIFTGNVRIIVFSGFLLISWAFLILSRLQKTKWSLSKLVACFFVILLILDLALLFIFSK